MLDIRYVAGLFDGDGYVRIGRWEKPGSTHIRYNLVGGVNMTHRPIIKALHDQFGGCFSRAPRMKTTHRTLFGWTIGNAACADFLRAIQPHLIVKAAEVVLALELQESIDKWRHRLGHHHKVHPQRHMIRAHRERLFADISALKHVRFDPA